MENPFCLIYREQSRAAFATLPGTPRGGTLHQRNQVPPVGRGPGGAFPRVGSGLWAGRLRPLRSGGRSPLHGRPRTVPPGAPGRPPPVTTSHSWGVRSTAAAPRPRPACVEGGAPGLGEGNAGTQDHVDGSLGLYCRGDCGLVPSAGLSSHGYGKPSEQDKMPVVDRAEEETLGCGDLASVTHDELTFLESQSGLFGGLRHGGFRLWGRGTRRVTTGLPCGAVPMGLTSEHPLPDVLWCPQPSGLPVLKA